METTTTMPLPDQDPTVQSSIRLRRLGLAEEDQAMTVTTLRPRSTMYQGIGLYIYPINAMVNMCHKLLYTKIDVLDLCC